MFFEDSFEPPAPENGAVLPEKTGAARFREILEENYIAVLLVNVLFLLTCIPVFTVPPAVFALHGTTRRMALGGTVRAADYLRIFRRGWKRGYKAFAVTGLPQALAGVGMGFYLRRAGTQPLFLLPFLFCSTVFLAALLVSVHLYALLDTDCSLREALRLSLALGLGKPARSVPAVLCCVGLPLSALLLLPLSLVYLGLIGFSLPFLLGNFFLRVVWRRYLDPAVTSRLGCSPEKTGVF